MRSIPNILTAAAIAVSWVAPLPADAQWWNPSSPIAPGKWEAESRSFVYSRDVYNSAVSVITQAVQAGDYAKLDRMHDDFLKMTLAGGNGSRMMAAFAQAFQATLGKDQQGFLKTWQSGAPGSTLRPVAEAQMWISAAWNERGGGYASTVSPEAMKIFGQDLDRAGAILASAGDGAKQSPLWYSTMIFLAGSRGDDSAKLDAILDEGLQRFPHYTAQYHARMMFLNPQWGGSYARIDAFIRRAVMNTQADEGTWMYAELYVSASQLYSGGDFFRETRASWPLMRHAFEDAVPRQLVDRNTYATFACMARDRDTTRRLLVELGRYADLGMGREGFTTEACREMVAEGK